MSFFDKPKKPASAVKVGEKRYYNGRDGYKKPCTIDKLREDERVDVTIENESYYNQPLRNIGELCD